MAATGMDLDVEMAMELFKKTEQFAGGTDEDFFKPSIDALEDIGVEGDLRTDIQEACSKLRVEAKAITEGTLQLKQNVLIICQDVEGFDADQCFKELADEVKATSGDIVEAETSKADFN